MLIWPDKDPAEFLDYQIDWSPRLVTGETISSSQWIVPSDLSGSNDSITGSVTTIWLSAGVSEQTYVLKNTIETSGGRTMDQGVQISVLSN